ncbi:MAG: phosphate ABC transporter permease PstA [Armatimonadota bacterium]
MSILRTRRSWWDLRRRVINHLAVIGAILATVIALIPLVMVLYYLVREGAPSLNLAFFLHTPAPIGEPGGGMANAIVGTLMVVGLACIIGLPIGLFGGIYLAEFGKNSLGAFARFAADVLSGAPSIVIGIFVYEIMVRPMEHFSAYAGGVALGIMMIPTVMRTTEELVRLVPVSQREASLALGATRWLTTMKVVLLAARGGVITGILLAIARIAGETAPLMFTVLGNNFWNMDPNQPTACLPLQIFTYAISPYKEQQAQAWTGALLLVMMIFVLSLCARIATRGRFKTVR